MCYWRLCIDPRSPLRRAALGLFLTGLVVMVLSLTLVVAKRVGAL